MHLQEKIFIFIGPPGSGKGSLSNLCIQKFGWKQLSTGNLCRKHVAKETSMGKKIDFAIKSGKLIPDDLITQMIVEWFINQSVNNSAVILDGYPRTVAQARFFNDFIQKNFEAPKLQIIKFLIPDDTVVTRLCHRYICQNNDCQVVYSFTSDSLNSSKKLMICDLCSSRLGRRSDDKESTILKRLKIYYKYEKELLNFYRCTGQAIKKVNVNKTLNEVFEDFKQIINVKFYD